MKNKALQKLAPALHRLLYRKTYNTINKGNLVKEFSEDITPYSCEGCPFGKENPDEEHVGTSTYNKLLYLCSIKLSKEYEDDLGNMTYVNPDDPLCTKVDWINKAQEELESLACPKETVSVNKLAVAFNEYYKEEATILYNKLVETIYNDSNSNKTAKQIKEEILTDIPPNILKAFERLLPST